MRVSYAAYPLCIPALPMCSTKFTVARFCRLDPLANHILPKDFKKYYIIPAPPEEVYTALTNPLSIEIWTGDETVMSTEAGSEFSLWGGIIVGKNLEFEEGKKIVQQWYFDGEPDISVVTIKL